MTGIDKKVQTGTDIFKQVIKYEIEMRKNIYETYQQREKKSILTMHKICEMCFKIKYI